MIYATNAIESLNATLRRSVRIRGHFPNDEAAEINPAAIARDHEKLEDAATGMGCGKSPIRSGVR